MNSGRSVIGTGRSITPPAWLPKPSPRHPQGARLDRTAAPLDHGLKAPVPIDRLRRVVQAHRAGAVEQLEIIQRVAAVDQDIGPLSDLERAGILLDTQQLGAAGGGGAQDFQWGEPGLLQKLQLPDISEAIGLEHEAGIAADGDAAAAVLVVVDEAHPEAERFPPLDLVRRRPAIPIGAVPAALRLEIGPERRIGETLVPIGPPRAHQVAVGVVDVESRHEAVARL